MFKRERFAVLMLYAISPIHAGSGLSTGAVDNPIQRERHTNWPVIQASSVKGAIRSHFRRFFKMDETENKGELDEKEKFLNYIFGYDRQDGGDKDKNQIPGAVSVSDAKILLFPVRSNVAPFVWITSPAVLKRFERDLEFAGLKEDGFTCNISSLEGEKAISLKGLDNGGKVILEDVVVEVSKEEEEENKLNCNLDRFLPSDGVERKILLVSDEVFKYIVSNCTEIQAQIKIDEEKGTTKDGSLRYQELLPSDSLLYTVLYVSQTAEGKLNADRVYNNLHVCLKDFIQIGGDETLGRGICKIRWIEKVMEDK